VACAAASRGVATVIRAIDEVEPARLANADAVIAGCWTPGMAPFGGRPMRRMERWIEGLSPFDEMSVGLFCTYRFFPHTFADTTVRTAKTLRNLSSLFEARGAKVAATRAINFNSIGEEAAILVERLLEPVSGD
jgi:hypothetical protein